MYMNEFDQFVKHELKEKYYARYTDDFVIISDDASYLKSLVPKIKHFLREKLRLNLHPKKVTIRKSSQGIDFLGYIILPHRIAVRTKTKKRMIRKLKWTVKQYQSGEVTEDNLSASLQSYLGVLSHADAHEFSEDLKNQFLFWKSR
ncbi:MAG TPA: RNA-directed DNA polymerase [Candidatus Paceibacterota bacterium]|nr:RNA-directed DNA polymerase [Candidatus Paceibacterota bacterium]